MIIVTMRMNTCLEKREELLRTVQETLKPVRLAPGCTSFVCYQDIEDANTFCFVEEWETQADLDNHVRSKTFKTLLTAMSLLDEPPDIRINAILHRSGWETVEAARSWR